MKKLFVALLIALLALSATAQQAASKPETSAVKPVAAATASIPAQALAKTSVDVPKAQPLAAPPVATAATPGKLDSVQPDAKKEGTGDDIKWTDKAQALFNGMLAVTTILLFFMACRQDKVLRESIAVAQRAAKAAEDTVKAMEDTAARELRAYVLAKKATVTLVSTALTWQDPWIVIDMHNSGSVPAKDVTYWVDFADEPKSFVSPTEMAAGVIPSNGGVIGPDGTFSPSCEIRSDLDGARIHSGQLCMFVFGEITYHDGFQANRTTRFCFMRSGEGWTGAGELDIWVNGNEFT